MMRLSGLVLVSAVNEKLDNPNLQVEQTIGLVLGQRADLIWPGLGNSFRLARIADNALTVTTTN